MRCCVPGCKNDSRHISKSQGVTFHVFPTEASLRTAWLQSLDKTSWEPKERSAVCSEHFRTDDLYETKSGLRKVKSGAVPKIIQDYSDCDYGQSTTLKACRICLVVNTKLLPIRNHQLDQAFNYLTGLKVCSKDKLPKTLCTECACRLMNSSKFRNKCLRTNSLMLEIVKKNENLTLENLKLIDRQNNQLTSLLQPKYNVPDHCDLILYEEYGEQTDRQEKSENINRIEVKSEEIKPEATPNEIFLSESDFSDTKVGDFDDVDTKDADYTDNTDLADRNHIEYSSDDSLPLEKTRRKRKKVTLHLSRSAKKQKIEKETVKKVRKRKLKNDSTQPKIDRRRKPFLNDDLNETLFSVTDLSFEEQVAEIQKRQDSANYKNSVFKCTECFKGFLDEDAYNSHMIRHTDQCGEFQCDICKTHFKHSHALRKHITAHHTQRFSCNQCPYVTTHRQTARLHERWHKGTKYQCPHCKDEFVKFTTYMGHVRIKHPSDFVCELCGYSFISAKGIELHKKLKHRMDNPQIPDDAPFCDLCNVRFMSLEAHRRHLKVSARHNSEDKETRESNKPKKGRKSLETREREKRVREKDSEPEEKRKVYPSQMRKAEGPIPCEQCGLQLEDSRAYHGHFRRMHPDKNRTNYPSMKSPCMCEVCGRIFQSYALLKDHTWVHTGERPFKCDSCGKSFRMKQRLVAHRRVHSQVKASYVCALCGKHFSTHSNRQRHMFIHTGLKPFKCEMCGKGFKHISEKRAHISYVHLKKPWPKRTRGKRRPDVRQGPMQQPSVPTSASEMDMGQPLWPPCNPKVGDMNSMMEDKAVYYNMKI